MDSNTTSVETKVSAAVLTPAAPVTAVSTLARPRTPMTDAPQVQILRVDDHGSNWFGNELGHDAPCGFAAGFGYASAPSSTKQMHNSIKFQIRLGPPCSPPV